MPSVMGVMIIAAIGCLGLGACGSSHPSVPQAPNANSTSQPTAAGATAAPSTTAPCVGLSIRTPPAPDAEGNPPCFYRDGWEADPSAAGINVYYFSEPSNQSKPAEVTADIRIKDGTDASQIAQLDAGEPVHQFQFPGIDKSTVQEVLLTTSDGRCFVIGPTGS